MFDLYKNLVGSHSRGLQTPKPDGVDSSLRRIVPPSTSIEGPPISLAANRMRKSFSQWALPQNVFVVLVFALLGVATSLPTVADETSEKSSLTDLRSQVSQLLRCESAAEDETDRREALTALCDLYVVLRKDQRYSQSEMLQQDATKIRRRLLTAASSITARQRRLKIPRPDDLQQNVDEAIRAAHESVEPSSGTDRHNGSSPNSDPYALSVADDGHHAAGMMDNGWQLVELIQRIIAPDFWQDSGGPGAITYFAMRRVLVVRATSDVHEQIRDLLLSLPR